MASIPNVIDVCLRQAPKPKPDATTYDFSIAQQLLQFPLVYGSSSEGHFTFPPFPANEVDAELLLSLSHVNASFFQFKSSTFGPVAASGTCVVSGKVPSEELMLFQSIRVGDKSFTFREPIQVKLSFENGMWFAQSKELSILAFGHDQSVAIQSFNEDFGVLWEEIAGAPDENLTADALLVKRKLIALVESIDAVAWAR
jgi:hypothetical protein